MPFEQFVVESLELVVLVFGRFLDFFHDLLAGGAQNGVIETDRLLLLVGI